MFSRCRRLYDQHMGYVRVVKIDRSRCIITVASGLDNIEGSVHEAITRFEIGDTLKQSAYTPGEVFLPMLRQVADRTHYWYERGG